MKATIAVFANSVKHGEHCVAGKDISTGSWIRPVADTAGAELSHSQCLCDTPNGKFIVKPLQKVEIKFRQHAPLLNQPENHVITDEIWEQKDRIEEAEIVSYLDTPDTLWGHGNSVNFAQIEARLIDIEQSLYLVKVDNLELFKAMNNKRRAIFTYAGIRYDLPVTDPNFYRLLAEPQYQQVLCVSLGEKFDPAGGNNFSCYKIIAAIF